MALPSLPAQNSTAWYAWASAVHTDVTANSTTLGSLDATIRGTMPNIRTVTGSTTLTATDDIVRVDSASSVAVTVPANADVSIPVGFSVQVRRHGAGAVSLTPAAGVTLNGSTTGAGQFRSYAVVKVATNVWDVEGGA